MHRAPTPYTWQDRFIRLLPYVMGGAIAAVLLILAASIRFAGSSPDTGLAGAAVTTTPAPEPVTSAAPTTSVPPATQPVATQPPATVAPATTIDAAPGPTYGGFVTLGVVGEPRSLNPLGLDAGTGPVAALINAVTTGAVRLDPTTLDPTPLAVEELPTLDNGGLEITDSGELAVRYTIRADAAWADATPITFEDFQRTYDIARLAPDVHSGIREKYGAIVAGSLTGKGRFVEFRLRDPGLGWVTLFDVLVPAHQVDLGGFGPAWSETMWFAGGPFRFVALDRDARRVELAANERSWLSDPDSGDPLPYLEGVTMRYFPTRSELLAAVEAGEVDVAAVGGDPDVLDRLAGDPALLLDVQRGPAWEQIGFQFGSGRSRANPQSLISEVKVREAIAAILDRGAIATEIQGAFARSLDSISGVNWPAANHSAWAQLDAFDQAAAAEFLAGLAGAAEEAPVLNFSTTASDADREVVARHLVAALEPLGFTVAVSRIEPGAYFLDLIIPGAFEVAAWAWEARPGPFGAIQDLRDHHLIEWPQGTDFYNWRNAGSPLFAEFEAGLSAAVAELDYAQLPDQLSGLEALLVDDVVLIPLYPELNGAVAAEPVRGFRHSILAGGEASTIAQWWRGD